VNLKSQAILGVRLSPLLVSVIFSLLSLRLLFLLSHRFHILRFIPFR